MDAAHPNLALRHLLQEGRVVSELFLFARRSSAETYRDRRGASRAILLIPGFLAGDYSLYPLARRLRAEGHRVFFAGIVANISCPRQAMDRLGKILHGASREAGDPVVVVGHSLGGLYARALAHRLPELVAHAILLGSPIKDPVSNSNPYVRMLFIATRRPHRDGGNCLSELASLCGVHVSEPPPEVPETLIYSKSDGVVRWPSCIESGPNVAVVEVRSTHCGMPYNFDALRAISECVASARSSRPSNVTALPKGSAPPTLTPV